MYRDRNVVKWTGIGFLIGLFVSVIFYIIASIIDNVDFSFHSIFAMHSETILIFIVDLFPIIFGATFFILASIYYSRFNDLKSKYDYEMINYENTLGHIRGISNDNFKEYAEDYKVRNELERILIDLQNKIKSDKELEAIRKAEDNQRNWTAKGYADFAELLRKDNDDLEKLAENILHNLIKYVGANQGGFFMLRDEDNEKYLDLVASYAYNRKKYTDIRFSWGEGLVGTCAIEKQKILVTDVPNNYISITSGLGDANPNCILLVPLKSNDEITGVIELATFKVFEKFEIEFIEKLAESIASTFISVDGNLKTRELLNTSQAQSEELASKEAELMNNIEELRATQEKAIQQGEEFESFSNAVNHTMISAEYDTNGRLINVNDKFINTLGFKDSSEMLGIKVLSFIDSIDQDEFKEKWDSLLAGGTHFDGDVKHTRKDGNSVWLMSTYVSKRDIDGSIESILFLATDVTKEKNINLDNKAQIEAINLSSMTAEIDAEGRIIECNDRFLENLKYQKKDIINKRIRNIMSSELASEFDEDWKNLLNGESYKGVMQFVDSNMNDKWFQGAASSIKDYYGNIEKVIYIANDVTDQKLLEIEALRQADVLKAQDEKLRGAQESLEIKLEEARSEMKEQFREIEIIKIRNELTLEGMLDATLTIRESGEIIFFNKAAEELWGYSKSEVTNQQIKMLFSEEVLKNDDFAASLANEDKQKIVGVRQEVEILTKTKEEESVLMLVSEANVQGNKTYTLFVQSIEIEMF